SVSVVLPASGCEMIANVRRRRISAVSSVMDGSSERVAGGAASAQGESQHRGILPAADRLVVAAPHAGGRAALQQVSQHAPPEPATAVSVGYAKVQHVRLTGADAHDSVSDDLTLQREHAAHISDPQAVA